MKWLRDRLGVVRKPQRYIFVVTYGRSGSTLLMNLLNTAESCLIRGENNNALYHLYRSYKAIVDAQAQHGHLAGKQTSAWWGIADVDSLQYRDALVQSFVKSVLQPRLGDKIVGFKEIRFSQEDIPDLVEFVEFMLTAFGDARIVVNHRNLDDVKNSKWWKADPGARKKLENIDDRLGALKNDRRIFHFSYDRAMSEHAHIEALFDWLALPFDGAKVATVLETRHSY